MTVLTPLARIEAHWEGVGWPEANRPLRTACRGTSSAASAGAASACRLAGSIEAQLARSSTPASDQVSAPMRAEMRDGLDLTHSIVRPRR